MKFKCPRYERHLFEYENMYISTTRRMQGIVGVSLSKHHVYVLVSPVHACLCVCAEVDKIEDG